MKSLLHKFIRFHDLNVIGIMRNDDLDHYYLIKIKKRGSQVNAHAIRDFPTIRHLKKEIDIRTPVVVVVDGKGVLSKRIDINDSYDIDWTKNLDFTTIYHTTFSNSRFKFISFCRKSLIDATLNDIRGEGFTILDFYVGPFTGALLNAALDQNQLFSNNCKLDFDSGELFEISFGKEKLSGIYDVGGTEITNYHLPLYGAGIHFYTKQNEISKNNDIDIEEILYKKAFDTLGIAVLAIFFLALLCSYTLIQYFNSKNAELNLQEVFSSQSYELIQKLEDQKKSKIKILNETGFSSSKFLSFYAFELSKNLPSEVRLSELNIYPLQKDVKTTEKVLFIPGKIIVKGYLVNEAEFNIWLRRLKDTNWIQNFEIISFKKDRKDVSQFEIHIQLKNV